MKSSGRYNRRTCVIKFPDWYRGNRGQRGVWRLGYLAGVEIASRTNPYEDSRMHRRIWFEGYGAGHADRWTCRSLKNAETRRKLRFQ